MNNTFNVQNNPLKTVKAPNSTTPNVKALGANKLTNVNAPNIKVSNVKAIRANKPTNVKPLGAKKLTNVNAPNIKVPSVKAIIANKPTNVKPLGANKLTNDNAPNIKAPNVNPIGENKPISEKKGNNNTNNGGNDANLPNNNNVKVTGIMNTNNLGTKKNRIEIVTGIKSSVNKTKNKIESAMKGLSNMSTLSDISRLSGVKKWGLIFLIAIVVIAIIMLSKFIIVSYYTYAKKGPYLIEGTKNANHTVIISQDPNSINYIPLKRSENEDGIEFTYMFWCLYMDTNLQNNNKWKHIFHKGNSTSFPNRAPGAWFHPKENKLRIYMNTYDSPLEYVDVGNIPIKKWFHCSIVLQNKISHLGDEDENYELNKGNNTLDIYINGKLKQSYQLQGTPNQNNGDVYVNLFGGFDGYLSKLRYMNRAIKFTELEDLISEGPAKVVTSDTGEIPPYLDDDWWFN